MQHIENEQPSKINFLNRNDAENFKGALIMGFGGALGAAILTGLCSLAAAAMGALSAKSKAD